MHLGRLLMSTPSDKEGLMAERLEPFPDDEMFEGNASEPILPTTGVNVHPHMFVPPGSSV